MTAPSQAIDLSFEVFPAEGEIAEAALNRTVTELAPLAPRFFSVTYGANGGARMQTPATMQTIAKRAENLGVAGHLTCLAGSRDETIALARHYQETGARWVVALRGDSASGAGNAFEPLPDGFRDSVELIAALRKHTDLRIAIGGYPEPHPDSRGPAEDLDHLKRKVDAGADTIVTQFFFDNDDFYRFVDKCRAGGIDVPIVPGIIPVPNFKRIARFAKRCGAKIPPRIAERFEKAEARGAGRELALAISAGQCDELRDQGVRAFHFYTLNRADLTLGVCQALGLDPRNPVDGDGALADEPAVPQALSA